MAPRNRDYVMTAMMRKTIEALASSMHRLRRTEELLRASQGLLKHPELSETTDFGTKRMAADEMQKPVHKMEEPTIL